MKFEISQQIIKILISHFMKICSLGVELFQKDGRTDGQTDRQTWQRQQPIFF